MANYKRKHSRYTQVELKFITDNIHLSDREIGLVLNRNYRGIEQKRMVLTYNGSPGHMKIAGEKSYPLRTKAFAYELYCSGESLKTISLSIGVTPTSVYRWICLFKPFMTGKKSTIIIQSKLNYEPSSLPP